MRIYAAADLHGKTRHVEMVQRAVSEHRPDVVVLAGDVTRRGGPPAFLRALNDLGPPIRMVHGNSDPRTLAVRLQPYACLQSIHLAAFKIGGVTLVGVGGTLPLPFSCRLGLHEAQTEARAVDLLVPGCVLVTHAPPCGTRDRVLGRFHAGSRAVRRLIRRCAPAIVICGHVHEQAGIGRCGDSVVVNCAVGRFSSGALIDYDGSKPAECRMLAPRHPEKACIRSWSIQR